MEVPGIEPGSCKALRSSSTCVSATHRGLRLVSWGSPCGNPRHGVRCELCPLSTVLGIPSPLVWLTIPGYSKSSPFIDRGLGRDGLDVVRS